MNMRWALGLLIATGCGPRVEVPGDNGDTGEGSTAPHQESADSGPIEPPPPMTTGVVSTSGSDGDSGSTGFDTTTSFEGGDFILRPDFSCLLHCSYCDLWSQNCPEGEKCAAWANDGSDVWNAQKCAVIDPNPGLPGDPCTVEGNAVTGLDSCDLGSMCWNVDPETNTGTCIALCQGSEADPQCPPGEQCMIANHGSLNLCIPECDPLLANCEAGLVCAPILDFFGCIPDGGQNSGIIDPYGNCNDEGPCPSGTACAPADLTALCDEGECCSPFCDLSSANPDALCTGTDTCIPWLLQPEEPYEHVGVCATL